MAQTARARAPKAWGGHGERLMESPRIQNELSAQGFTPRGPKREGRDGKFALAPGSGGGSLHGA